MPKGRGRRDLASRRSRVTPYLSNLTQEKEAIAPETQDSSFKKDWEDATCAVCMDFPHNAVLLLCSSHDKGCRPYMCATSYRHSNCLDQFKKAYSKSSSTSVTPTADNSVESSTSSLEPITSTRSENDTSDNMSPPSELQGLDLRRSVSDSEDASVEEDATPTIESTLNRSREKWEVPELACPLCRGQVKGWTVVEAARKYLNAKTRSCSQDSCSFIGTYEELRKHARHDHPLARPQEIDPDRQRNWRRLERERDRDDVISTIRATMPGALVLGDYVIEGGNIGNEGDDLDFPGDERNWLNVFLLFQAFGPAANIANSRNIPSRLRGLARGYHRLGMPPIVRQGIWGENSHGSPASEGNMSVTSDAREGNTSSARRRRRSRRRSSDLT
uniref:TSA: Wollemia nobilis Ref_Wollemi_Transcript_25842_1743 transcribed RNA sequence n=1 Tax=Wollemia nobilis TaxID=56998 RepID=A0A0C9S477_9CONI